MKQKFWQTEEFRQLEKEWYERLEKNNFEDIEKTLNGKSVLKQRASNCYRSSSEAEREGKLRYYELLCHNFHKETQFKSEAEEFIIERRSQGLSIKRISEQLEIAGERCHRMTVRRVIQRFEAKWGMKSKRRG